jgi:hypothetical protein
MKRLGTVLYRLDTIEQQILRKIFKGFGDDFTDGGKRSVPAVETLGYVWLLNTLN